MFLWIYRASFNWNSIRELVSGMRNHLKANVGESSADYSLLFREMFCVTAQALADSMSLPLERLGITYDQILETGIKQQRSRSLSGRMSSITTSFGRGQFLFLVKHASRAETAHFLSLGYRFADPVHIVGNVARAMQIDRTDAESHLKKMSRYNGPSDTFEPGVHLAFFGMRPNVRKGFNVMVPENRSHVIPSMQLPVDVLDDEQKPFVMSFVGKTVDQVLQELRVPQTHQVHKLNYDMQTFRYDWYKTFLIVGRNSMVPSSLYRKKSMNQHLWTQSCSHKHSKSPPTATRPQITSPTPLPHSLSSVVSFQSTIQYNSSHLNSSTHLYLSSSHNKAFSADLLGVHLLASHSKNSSQYSNPTSPRHSSHELQAIIVNGSHLDGSLGEVRPQSRGYSVISWRKAKSKRVLDMKLRSRQDQMGYHQLHLSIGWHKVRE